MPHRGAAQRRSRKRGGLVKHTLQVRLSQHLALTPQLQQSIRLLQLSTLELHQEVEQMLEQNPFLESEEEAAPLAEPMAERLSSAERAGERESERAADGGDEPAGVDSAEFGTTARDDWENGTESEDFDGIRETPGKARTHTDGDEFDDADRDAPVGQPAGPPARAVVGAAAGAGRRRRGAGADRLAR